jgi:hypothetical protein
MRIPNFWPLDDDPEDPIYDSVAWDLPGYRNTEKRSPRGGWSQRSQHKKIRL